MTQQGLDDRLRLEGGDTPIAEHPDAPARRQVVSSQTVLNEIGEGTIPGISRTEGVEIDHDRIPGGEGQAERRERAEKAVLRRPNRERRNQSISQVGAATYANTHRDSRGLAMSNEQ
jgi:hypothetical protein